MVVVSITDWKPSRGRCVMRNLFRVGLACSDCRRFARDLSFEDEVEEDDDDEVS